MFFTGIKDIYRLHFPVSKETFNLDSEEKNKRIDELSKQIQELKEENNKLLLKNQNSIDKQWHSIDSIDSKLEALKDLIVENHTDSQQNASDILKVLSEFTAEQEEYNKDRYDSIRNDIDKVNRQMVIASRAISEALWGEIFHDSIIDSTWLKDKSFNPGRWAIGYPAMYVLYRVLNEFHPSNILELGLGQSTKMISQYVLYHDDVHHKIIEHDKNWISFFMNSNHLSEKTQLIQKDITETTINGKDKIRCYKDFEKDIIPDKYDLIFIDAPIGESMKDYSRVDTLNIIPECLKDSFVIMMDDIDRSGERNTLNLLEDKLQINDISYKRGLYSGKRDTAILCSLKESFLTSL